MPHIITTLKDLTNALKPKRKQGASIGFVPTMGALHRGHGSLIEYSKKECDVTVVSIFVNPKQFAPHEDLVHYPRPFEKDIKFLEDYHVDFLFMPRPEEIYPADFVTSIHLSGVAEGLEGIYRPHFFSGVATIVTKLLMLVLPNVAYFGEKDYQQLCVIKQCVKDLSIPVTITGVPTLREADGLALSSRNIYLSPEERQIASQLYQILQKTADKIISGIPPQQACNEGIISLEQTGFKKTDYLEIRYGDNLSVTPSEQARLLVASTMGTTRLIDNIGFMCPV